MRYRQIYHLRTKAFAYGSDRQLHRHAQLQHLLDGILARGQQRLVVQPGYCRPQAFDQHFLAIILTLGAAAIVGDIGPLYMGIPSSARFECFLFQLVFGHADSFLDSFADVLRSAQLILLTICQCPPLRSQPVLLHRAAWRGDIGHFHQTGAERRNKVIAAESGPVNQPQLLHQLARFQRRLLLKHPQ